MPSLYTADTMVMVELQALFATSVKPPASWQLVVGTEMVADVDAFRDDVCAGLGFLLIASGGLELGTSQQAGGSLYMRQALVAGVLRCAPTIGDDLRSPTPAEQAAYAQLVLDDKERLLQLGWAVSQFDWITEQDVSDPAWEAIPVDGGAGGGAVSFEMAVIGDCP
jgi:hypothetical protein